MVSPTEDYNWTSPTGRKEIMLRGLGYLSQNPITGIGISNFPRAEGTISEAAEAFEQGGAGVKWSAAHDSFLQSTVEMGLVGGGLFAALVFVGIRFGRRLSKRLRGRAAPDRQTAVLFDSLLHYLPVSFIGFAVSGTFLSFAYMDPVYLLSAISAGALAYTVRLPLASAPVAPASPAVAGGLPRRGVRSFRA